MLIVETTPIFLPEKQYTLDVLLGELLGLPFRITPVPGAAHYRLVLPNGKILTVEDHFFGKFSNEKYWSAANIPADTPTLPHPFQAGEQLNCIFGRPYFDADTCGLDLVASAFFMLTRWEEYARPERDRHGRFPATAALAHRAGFTGRPVVNEYAALFRQMLARLGYEAPEPPHAYRLHLSHDVDHPRLWWSAADYRRTLGGSIFKRFNPREAVFWLQNRRPDPFDTFDALMDLSEKNGLVSQFNFMGERPRGSDCWYALDDPFVRDLLAKIERRGHQIGFHPSYEAFGDAEKFRAELTSLRARASLPVVSGRQHYLRFAAPHTWQTWDDAGLAWDSTLGYAETPGFRCGICRDFPVFNFLTRKKLALREKPLVAMDVSLALYRRDQPAEALDLLLQLRRTVQKHRGEFVLLWHNSSLNDYFWRPWREVYRAFLFN